MNSVARHAVLTAVSFVVGTLLVWWVEPTTTAGVAFLVAGCVVLINALGAVFWRSSEIRAKVWVGWALASLLLLPQTACENARTDVPASDDLAFINAFAGCMYSKGNPTAETPGPGKDSRAFAADRETCKRYALSQYAAEAEAANNRAVGGSVLSTVLGAGLGAAVGGGRGAAIGAAAGGAVGGGYYPYSRSPLRPTRTFLNASEIPPAGVGAYGVVALRTLPTPANHDRLMMLCRSFLASLPAQQTLPASVSLKDQMITVWPLSSPPPQDPPQCDYLISNYDLYGGISAVEDAAGQHYRLSGRGPFLIGWSPSTMRGRPDAVVLVVDMSGFETQASFDDAFRFWQDKVVEDPSLWREGFRLERLRLAIRDFADHYGESILGALKFWRSG